jgi:EAL domain-containing protein (putative c-di-GMP-specific phosphodiesterase class I)
MMIGDISWIIIEKVCAFIAAHPDLPLQAISINLSAQQFMEVDMEEHLDAIIERYGISHHRIKIEITERVICEDLAKTQNIMTSLSEKGIGFYLDDFGTAYSNIASVLSLPFETIKLDKSLMDKLSGTPKDYQFLDALIQMFRNAGYTLVAEGAEQATTVDALRQMGVEQIQSFYYARPMPGQNLIRFLEDHHKESL